MFNKNKCTKVPLLDRSAPFMDGIVVSKDEVTKLLKGLNPSKALGPDEIHPRVLKELATELGTVFARLFQQSIDTGEIPKERSLANICPLFKKMTSQLRAITARFPWLVYLASYSNTQYVQISWLILMNINSCQIGNMHSGKDIHIYEIQLTMVINDWATILVNRGQVDTFILHFEKVLDAPPNELLKSKLFSYGAGG